MSTASKAQIGKSSASVVTPAVRLGRAKSNGESAGLLQRSAVNANPVGAVPRSVNQTLQAPGQPLDTATRSFMEARFGRDFSGVRVHADSQAANSARALNAQAYTLGKDIAFGRGQYEPGTSSGKALLVHELTHVVQQEQTGHTSSLSTNLQVGDPSDPAERHAERMSRSVAEQKTAPSPLESTRLRDSRLTLRRKLVVNPGDTVPTAGGGAPQKLTAAVQGLLDNTCASGGFKVDAGSGNVTHVAEFCEWHPPLLEGITEAAASPTPVGCGCLCDVVDDGQTTTVAFRAGGPSTSPGSVPGAGPGQGGVKANPTVDIDPRFQGQYLINGNWVDVPFFLLFSHELCGHARPKMHGTHVARGAKPAGGTPPQEQAAVDVERQIAAEHKLPRRPDDYSGAARQKP